MDWYRVPGSQFMRDGQSVPAYWSRNANRIVLAEGVIENGTMVRHEMLHALLRVRGHPRSQFLAACASVVVCQGSCIQDAGRWQLPRQDYAVLPPESLDVASRAELLPPESDGQRWFALEVTVRNARGRAVVVAAPGDRMTPPTFGYDLRGPLGGISRALSGGISGGQVATDSSTLFFQPFETKQYLFEFHVKSEPFDSRTSGLREYHLSPGSYLVRGGYARRFSAYDTISVSP